MQKLNQEIPKQTTEKAKMSDAKCQIIILARFHWRKHEQTRFRSITSCIRKRYHENPLAETCFSLRKHTEKWSGFVVSAATETWINDMYPLPETHVSRCVSATLSCVSATFQSADSWHFVLWYISIVWKGRQCNMECSSGSSVIAQIKLSKKYPLDNNHWPSKHSELVIVYLVLPPAIL